MAAEYALFEKDREVVVSDGTPIRYTVQGEGGRGPDVVLASGWSCSDAWWAEILPGLVERGHRVVLPDTRGHGESGLPRDPGRKGSNLRPEDMSVERIAFDLIEVAREASCEKVIYAGHSMGVQTILEAYRHDPSYCAGLATIAGPYENPLRSFYGQSFWDMLFPLGRVAVLAIPTALTSLWWKVGNNASFGLWAAQRMGAVGPKVTKEALAPYIAHLSTREPAILFKAIEGMRNHSAADLLSDIAVPVAVIVGAKDNFTPAKLQRHMAEVIPEAELIEFEDGTHALPAEEPEAIVDAIDRLVAKVAAREPSTRQEPEPAAGS